MVVRALQITSPLIEKLNIIPDSEMTGRECTSYEDFFLNSITSTRPFTESWLCTITQIS